MAAFGATSPFARAPAKDRENESAEKFGGATIVLATD
jgi:hypothetical protein